MKKSLKLAVLLCLAALFSLVAVSCNKPIDPDVTTEDTSVTISPTETTTPEETTTPDGTTTPEETTAPDVIYNRAPSDVYHNSNVVTNYVKMNVSYTDSNGQRYNGDIVVVLDETNAPITVANFKKLVREGFYDGLTFHRVIENFVIQGGDPEGTGKGGSDETIKGEFSENGVQNTIKHERGVISMARADACDSATSQFFIVHYDQPHLDGLYAAFGYVIFGMQTVDGIAAVDTDHNDKPLIDVVINFAVFISTTPDDPTPDDPTPPDVPVVDPEASQGLEFTLNDDGKSYSVTGIGTCKDTKIVIPAAYNGKPVTTIGEMAFAERNQLAAVVIPNGITYIGDVAFALCTNLTSITISASVTSIGTNPFAGCENITNISIDKNNPIYYNEGNCIIEKASKTLITGFTDSAIPQNVQHIGIGAFGYCVDMTSKIIPNHIVSIDDFAFEGCSNLASITIPDSITSIGEDVFRGCDSLTSITFDGTVAQWNNLPKGESWDSNADDYTVYCLDGTISKDGTVTYKSEVQMIYESAMRLDHEEMLEGTYTLTGIVTIVNNVYLEHYQNIDVTIMVDGYSFYCFHLRGDGMQDIGIGDTITVTGNIGKYNDWVEFGRFCQLDSRIPNAGGDPACKHDYIDGVVCRCGHIKETGDPEPNTTLTIPEANALGLTRKWMNPTQGRYYVTGVIESIVNTNGKHGNMYIRDENGNVLYLYSLFNADGSQRFDVMDNQPKVGDTITVYGALSQYEGEAQMINAFMVEHIPGEES